MKYLTPSVSPSARQPSLLRRATPVGTRSPYSLPFVILPVPARSPFRFIRHWRRSTPNPGRGAFLLLTKSCPRVRGKWHEVPKGVRLKTAECRELFPLSFAYAQQLPHKWWRLLVQYKHGVQCRTPSRSDRFKGVTGVARGPKGRNRNLPWPLGKKSIK